MLFDTIYKKMERELSDRKKMMANVIEVRCVYTVRGGEIQKSRVTHVTVLPFAGRNKKNDTNTLLLFLTITRIIVIYVSKTHLAVLKGVTSSCHMQLISMLDALSGAKWLSVAPHIGSDFLRETQITWYLTAIPINPAGGCRDDHLAFFPRIFRVQRDHSLAHIS